MNFKIYVIEKFKTIRLILFFLVINKAIAFVFQKLSFAKLDKITEILRYQLIDYIDEIKD